MPRVALVHDFLLDLRGAERVFAAICERWPERRRLHRGLRPARHRRPLLRPSRSTRRSCRSCSPPRARSACCCRSIRTRSSPRPARLRRRHLVLERVGARGRSSTPEPCTSVTATTRSGTRGPSVRRRSRARQPLVRPVLCAPCSPLAPVGLDRRPAGRPLRRLFEHHRGPRPPLLRPRVRGPAPAGGDRPLLARARRRALPDPR